MVYLLYTALADRDVTSVSTGNYTDYSYITAEALAMLALCHVKSAIRTSANGPFYPLAEGLRA